MAAFINNTWQAEDDEIATHVHVKELTGIGKSLYIQAGVCGHVYHENIFQESISEGGYTLDSWLGRINRLGRNLDVTFMLHKTEPFYIDVNLATKTKDALDIDVHTRVEIKVGDAEALKRFFMHNTDTVTLLNIKSQLITSAKPVIQRYFLSKSIDSLLENQDDLMVSLNRFLEDELSQTLSEKGLELEEWRVTGVSHDEINEINELKAQTWIVNNQKKAELEEQIKMQELYQEAELLKLKEDALKRELQQKQYDQKAQDSLQVINQLENILEARNKKEAIKAGAEKDLWLIQQDLQQASNDIKETELDWDLVKQQAKLRRDKELNEVKVRYEIELKEKQVEQERKAKEHHDNLLHEAKIRELKNEAELAAFIANEEERRLKREQIQQKMQSEFEWAQGKAHLLAGIEKEKLELEQLLWKTSIDNNIAEADAISIASIRDITRETEEKDAIQEIELKDAEKKKKLERLAELNKIDQAIEQQEHNRKAALIDQEHRHKIEAAKTYKDIDISVLIQQSSPETQQALLELQKIRVSEQQTQDDSPLINLLEKAMVALSEQSGIQQSLNEITVLQQKTHQDKDDRLERVLEKAFKTMRQISKG